MLVRLYRTDFVTTIIFSTKLDHEDGHADICLKTDYLKGAKGSRGAFLQRKRVT